MDFSLTETQQLIRETARDFARQEVAPGAAERDETHRFPAEIVRQLAALGFMGVAIPEELGGSGLDPLCYVLAMEEISRACAGTGVIMSVNNSLVCDPLHAFGTPEQHERWLRPLARGELLGCFGLSEPGTGSDAVNLKTTAKQVDGGYLLDGTKNFITNAPEADLALIFAVTDREKRHKGVSCFLVPMKTPGVSLGSHDKKVGIRCSHSSPIILEEVLLPVEAMLGRPGDGFRIAMTPLDGGRIGVAAMGLGLAQGALDEAIAYAKERRAFGQPISRFQAIQAKIADIATEIEAARLLTYRAAVLKDRGENFSLTAAQAKLKTGRLAVRAAEEAVQIHGGYGYIEEYPVCRFYRDAKILTIGEGTDEVQQMVIARALGC